MTIYKNKVEYVRTDWCDPRSIKPSEVKKNKLENQGYTLIKSWVEYPDVWVSEYEKKEIKKNIYLDTAHTDLFGI